MSAAPVIDPSLLDLFRVELETHSRILETGLVEVESDQAPEKIEPLMRAAHSIKGAARIVGLDVAVTLAHAMEDLLSAAQHGKLRLVGGHIDLLLQGNDLFKRLSTTPINDLSAQLASQTGTIDALARSLVASMSAAPAQPAALPASPAPPADPAPSPSAPPAAPPPAPAPVVPAPTTAPARKEEERLIRVLAESLSRIIGLSGECLVQTKSLKPFSQGLRELALKQRDQAGRQEAVLENLDKLDSNAIADALKRSLADLNAARDLLARHAEAFENFSRRHENTVGRLYDEVIACRMRPFADGCHGFPRMVRDLARALSKRVEFKVVGSETRVDRDILEKLEAPLTHLIRNAIDHGIETPEERTAAGKSPEGKVVIEARHLSGMLNLTVSDDGRGVNSERLRQKVVEKRLLTPEMAANLSPAELTDFLFLPGFSTAENVSEISGRGVGLDVVQNMVQAVGGSLHVESKPGQGTSFSLVLPLTLSVVRALLFDISGEPYALPLSRIDRVLEVVPEELSTIEDRQFCMLDDERVGIVDAHQLFGTPAARHQSGRVPVLVISDALSRYGLAVDRLRGERELVVIPLDPRLGKVPDISAGAILEDGAPLLILDADDLVRSVDALLNQGRLQKVGAREKKAVAGRKRVLVVDDSLTVREVERKLIENAGFLVTTAVDGVDGWNAMQTGRFDLVVSDIDMPRMNGIDFVRRLRQDPRFKDLPVMIVSYKEREEDRLKGLEAGANYYLTKSSFHDATLVNAVHDLIGKP